VNKAQYNRRKTDYLKKWRIVDFSSPWGFQLIILQYIRLLRFDCYFMLMMVLGFHIARLLDCRDKILCSWKGNHLIFVWNLIEWLLGNSLRSRDRSKLCDRKYALWVKGQCKNIFRNDFTRYVFGKADNLKVSRQKSSTADSVISESNSSVWISIKSNAYLNRWNSLIWSGHRDIAELFSPKFWLFNEFWWIWLSKNLLF
jgi:hypothetical protein